MRRAVLLRRSLLAACIASCAGIAACELVAGLKLPEQVDGPPDSASVLDAGDDAASATALACDPKLPPKRPTQAAPDLDNEVFAVRFVASGPIRDAGTDSGPTPDRSRLCASAAIDLDGLSTCAKLDDGSTVPGSCKSRFSVTCDTIGGGDNAGASAASLILGTSPSAGSDPNVAFDEGRGGILIELGHYNGLDDDADITVSFIFAFGVDDGAGHPVVKPRWDGTDSWIPERGSFKTKDQPAYVAEESYVSGGVLVARFRHTPFSFGGAGARLDAEELVVTGRLVRAPGGGEALSFDQGRLAIRMSTDAIFNYLGTRLSDGIPFCSPQQRANITNLVCGAADLLQTTTVDPTKPCDAVSYAVGFYAARARHGPPSDDSADATPPEPCEASDWPPSCTADF